MRSRMIKPEFWRSEDIAALTVEVRLVFIGLWSCADDYGVGLADPRAIAADLFAFDDPYEARDLVERALDELSYIHIEHSDEPLIKFFIEDGHRYFYIVKWAKHQRIDHPSKSRYPKPPAYQGGTYQDQIPEQALRLASLSRDSREDSRDLREGSRVEVEVEVEREREKNVSSAKSADSDRGDIQRLCDLLAELIEANGVRRPAITKGWRDAARLLLDRDKHPEEEIARVIRWCQADDFWQSNILSMPKLRKQYDRLFLQTRRDGRLNDNHLEPPLNIWTMRDE